MGMKERREKGQMGRKERWGGMREGEEERRCGKERQGGKVGMVNRWETERGRRKDGMKRAGEESRVGKQVGWSCSKINWGRPMEKRGAGEWDMAGEPQHQGKVAGMRNAKAAISPPRVKPNSTLPKSSFSFVSQVLQALRNR